ncbi:MAG: methyl-accepting chemotaxis protein [Candidatus Omnitrophica bacterium]|nr:methyl-accepting chemotaxis protein [Candidatus Omnitrophota bacterium]
MTQPASLRNSKRRNFYIDKDFQSRFIVKFCALVVGGAGLTISLLYWFSRQSTSVSIFKSRVVVMTTADFILPLLVQTVVVVSIIVGLAAIVVTLFVSHKIAGPLFRFKQTFKELSEGNFSSQVKLRKDDQLHEVATEFNQMIVTVRTKMHSAREDVLFIKNAMDVIGEFNVDEHKRKQFNDLKAKLQELEKTIDFFKI